MGGWVSSIYLHSDAFYIPQSAINRHSLLNIFFWKPKIGFAKWKEWKEWNGVHSCCWFFFLEQAVLQVYHLYHISILDIR